MSTRFRTNITPRRVLAAALACATVAVSACGDDPDDSSASLPSTETGPGDAAKEYCALVEEIGEGLPTDEQFDQILAVAPEEIADNLAVVVAAVREDPAGAFDDPDVTANFPAIEAYESKVCGGQSPAEVDADAQVVPVAASDYAFEMLATPEAGAVSFVITNEGEELHEMILARLAGDTTVDEALASEDPVVEGLVEEAGFAGSIAAGAEAVINADLTSGRYVAVCFIPAPDGLPHSEKGMIAEFTVE